MNLRTIYEQCKLPANELCIKQLGGDTKEHYSSGYSCRAVLIGSRRDDCSTPDQQRTNRKSGAVCSSWHRFITAVATLRTICGRLVSSRKPNADRGTTCTTDTDGNGYSGKGYGNKRSQRKSEVKAAGTTKSKSRPLVIHLVAFDLKHRRHNYRPFFAALQTTGAWFNFFDNSVLINTTETVEHLWERLNLHVTGEDFLLVIRVTSEYHGWLPPEAWNWLDAERDAGNFGM